MREPRADWKTWRDEQISWILKPRTDLEGKLFLDREEVAQKCAKALQKVRPGDPASSNFVRFLRAQAISTQLNGSFKRDHAFGLEISDLDYWKEAEPWLQFPPLLKSSEFLEKMSNSSTYGEAARLISKDNESRARDRKWVVIPYLAKFIRSVDRTTYGRMLIMIPNEPTQDGMLLDRWINFAILVPGQESNLQPMSVSMVAVKHSPSSANSKAFLMDFMRMNGALVPNVELVENPSKNCYDCHKSAVIPILPEKEFGFSTRGELTEVAPSRLPDQVNEKIQSYGRTLMPHQDQMAYGPCIGPRELSDETILATDSTLGQASVARVKAASNCASCHEGFASINFIEPVRTDREMKSMKSGRGLAQSLVEDGIMPPTNHLNKQERGALWKALSKDYLDLKTGRGAFVDWLKSD